MSILHKSNNNDINIIAEAGTQKISSEIITNQVMEKITILCFQFSMLDVISDFKCFHAVSVSKLIYTQHIENQKSAVLPVLYCITVS